MLCLFPLIPLILFLVYLIDKYRPPSCYLNYNSDLGHMQPINRFRVVVGTALGFIATASAGGTGASP